MNPDDAVAWYNFGHKLIQDGRVADFFPSEQQPQGWSNWSSHQQATFCSAKVSDNHNNENSSISKKAKIENSDVRLFSSNESPDRPEHPGPAMDSLLNLENILN